jgi:WG containing repeat
VGLSQSFGHLRFVQQKSGLYNLVDTANKVVLSNKIIEYNPIDFSYSFFTIKDDRYLILKKKKQAELLDLRNGKILFTAKTQNVKFTYPDEWISERSSTPASDFKNPMYFGVETDQGSYVVNTALNQIIWHKDYTYIKPYITLFNHNIVIDAGQYSRSVITPDGKELIDSLMYVEELPNGRYIFQKMFVWGLADKFGVVDVASSYYFLDSQFMSGCHDLIIAKDKNKFTGVINSKGQIKIPFIYDHISDDNRLYNQREHQCHNGLLFLYKNNLLSILDSNNTIFAEGISRFDANFDNKRFLLVNNEDFEGIFDVEQKKLTIPLKYNIDNVYGREPMITNRMVIGATYNGRWGLLDMQTGAILAPFEYQQIDPLGNSFDRTDASWSTTANAESDRFFVLRKNGQWGILDYAGKEIVPFEYELIEAHNYDLRKRNLIRIKKNGLFGLMDLNSLKVIIPCEYHSINDRLDGTKQLDGKMVTEDLLKKL